MLFNLENDSTHEITFYLVPDTYSEIPAARVTVDGEVVLEFEANEVREALVVARRHENGRCGFKLDASMLPGIADLTDLSIFEKSTGAMVYRRRPANAVNQKILRLETRLLPSFSFDKKASDHFQYFSRQIENFGLETSTQMFRLNYVESVYLSGRINFKNYQYHVDSVFAPIICIDNPYAALAERLLVLSKLEQRGLMHILSDRDAMLLAPAAGFASGLPLDDGKALRKALRNVPQEVAVALANPLTRLLTSSMPDEMPRRGALASALDTIANFAIVGLYEDAAGFRDAFAHFVERDKDAFEVPQVNPAVKQLADLIEKEARAEALIEADLEVYWYVKQAHESAVAI